jgi:histidine kinase-like protein
MAGEIERPASRPGTAAPAVSLPLVQDFNAGSLYALRSAVSAHAAAAGLSGHRVYEVTASAHELAANAVLHGAGHGSLRLWAQDGYLYCAVADDGPAGNGDGPAAAGGKAVRDDGLAGSAAGPAAPAGPAGDAGAAEAGGTPWPVVHGHGLWLVGEIADDVRVERGDRGTVITLRFAIGPDGDGR